MTSRCPRFTVVVLTVAALGLLSTVAGAHGTPHGLTSQEERGRQIYFTGKSPSGVPISGWFGEDLIETPLTTSTCASCHGYDGTGRTESGVIPSNVTWTFLTKTYGHDHPDGLHHPPFDEASLRDYMVNGNYPGGNYGDPSMPVYEISDQDMDDLLAFMKRLGEVPDPGVEPDFIRVGTILPQSGPLVETGQAIRRVLEASFADVNGRGGIFGRRLELVVQPAGDVAEVQTWLAEDLPFALVGTLVPGNDKEVHGAVSLEGVPVVGPFSMDTVSAFDRNRNLFYLFAGFRDQLKALVLRTAELTEAAEVNGALVYPEGHSLGEMVEDLSWTCRMQGWSEVEQVRYDPREGVQAPAVDGLRERSTEVVAFVGNESQARQFLAAADAAAWTPRVLLVGPLVGRLAAAPPPAFREHLLFSYPTLPQDRREKGVRDLVTFLETHRIPSGNPQATISAYVAAQVLVAALQRAGWDLSRERFVEVLEKFYNLETGLTRPISFTRNRRVGVRGAWVLSAGTPEGQADRRASPAAVWVGVQ